MRPPRRLLQYPFSSHLSHTVAVHLGSQAATLRAARTAGRAAGEREEHERKRYPPEVHPQAGLTPLLVEGRGRLRTEVLSFLRQPASADELLRSGTLARATREVSVISKSSLAALLLAAEPRPAAV